MSNGMNDSFHLTIFKLFLYNCGPFSTLRLKAQKSHKKRKTICQNLEDFLLCITNDLLSSVEK